MKTIKYFCDICGKEATKEDPVYNLLWIEQTTDGSDGDMEQVVDGISDKDICGVCTLKASLAISEAFKTLKKLEEPKPEKAKPVKRHLDDGKMLALRKAGWTYEKIADEMGCTDQTVINHIRAMEQKGAKG
jgi:hypothetical protein